MKIKSHLESLFTSRKLVMPDQANPHGSLFGGILFSWIDMTAYMTAQRHSENRHVVTAAINNVEFHGPVYVGEHVLLSSELVRVGNSSMGIRVRVEKENPCTGERTPAADAWLTFVSIGSDQKPKAVPRLLMSDSTSVELKVVDF